VPWIICCAIYGLLLLTYKHDRLRNAAVGDSKQALLQ
jgi:hypothetical protein